MVTIELTSHPTDETCRNADLPERRDCDAGSARRVGVNEQHDNSVVRMLVASGRDYKGPDEIGKRTAGGWCTRGFRSFQCQRNASINSVSFTNLAR